MSSFSTREKYEAARDEEGKRVGVYRRFVAEGRMTQEQATQKIAVMAAIRRDYAEKLKAEAAANHPQKEMSL